LILEFSRFGFKEQKTLHIYKDDINSEMFNVSTAINDKIFSIVVSGSSIDEVFEKAWSRLKDLRMVIAGESGWRLTDEPANKHAIAKAIQSHPRLLSTAQQLKSRAIATLYQTKLRPAAQQMTGGRVDSLIALASIYTPENASRWFQSYGFKKIPPIKRFVVPMNAMSTLVKFEDMAIEKITVGMLETIPKYRIDWVNRVFIEC
jgi:hypothetical protein